MTKRELEYVAQALRDVLAGEIDASRVASTLGLIEWRLSILNDKGERDERND